MQPRGQRRRRRISRPKISRRGVAFASAGAIFATMLALAPASFGVGSGDGTPPVCGSDVANPVIANCIAPDVIPDGASHPADPVVSPATTNPFPQGTMRRQVVATGPVLGGDCPSGTIPFSSLPCTNPGVLISVKLYNPGGTEPGLASSVGLDTLQGSPTCSTTHECLEYVIYDPRLFTGTRTIIGRVSSTIMRDPRDGGPGVITAGYSFVFTIVGRDAPPVADFTATADTVHPGSFTFSSTSTDPANEPLTQSWNFGDGSSGAGAFTSHAYTKPGDFTVTLTVTNLSGRSDSKERTVTVAAPHLGVAITLLDGKAPPLEPDLPVRVHVTVSASDDGIGSLNGLTFGGGQLLTISPANVFDVTAGPVPAPPAGGFSLAPGAERSFDMTLHPTTIGSYTLSTSVAGKDAIARAVSVDATSRGVIGTSPAITIALDPPFANQEETADGPKPVNVEAKITLHNTSGVTMTDVKLTSLTVTRTKPGQLLAVTQTGGATPGLDGVPVGTLAPDQEKVLTATFRADDDAEVEFAAMATAIVPGGGNEIGLGKKRWSVKPKYLLRLESTVDLPTGNALLPAGEAIRISGTLKNLSNTATLEVGPPYPVLRGNAGVMSLTYDAVGGDPRDLTPVGRITLQPGETQQFTLRILTSYSDPTRIEGDNRTGGTLAEAQFTPYGQATLEDGSVVPIAPEQIEASESALTHRVGIDDSIAIPTFDPIAFGQAILLGAVEGVWSATAAILASPIELGKLPFTILRATSEFQSAVWNSFTEEERAAFVKDAGFMAYSVLIRNADLGREDAGTLIEKAQAATLQDMIKMENDSRIGDYTKTTELYSSFASNAISQVVVPIALAKMAKSPVVVNALARFQRALQTRMAPLLTELASIQRIEELGPILSALASGTELTPEQVAILGGISPEELAELQRLATKYNFLLTVRSRHASSIEWITKKFAVLKPETLKIKSVSELDAQLGYRDTDIGSLVFRKPDVLRMFEAGEGNIDELFDEYLRSKHFVPGTGEYANASKRLMDRIEEWQKYEQTYQAWSKRGWIDVSFNYKGNAVADPTLKGTGQYVGFHLAKYGEDEYVVQMMNNRRGHFVPVTGDVDGIAFTHLDGSPLTATEHLSLLEDLRKSPLLAARHGESATFVKGGVNFVVSQFKPGEPGLQIAPGALKPRIVRLNPTKSRWASPFDYHLFWDGGYKYSGSYIPRGAIPLPPLIVPAADVGAEPNVGRCRVTYSTAPGAQPLVLDSDGRIAEVVGNGLAPSPLADQCFTEGEVVAVNVLPTTEVLTDTPAGAKEIEIASEPFLAAAGNDGLAVGQEVSVGAGSANVEPATITGFGSIIVNHKLTAPHKAGELIVVTKAAAVKAGNPPPKVTQVKHLAVARPPSDGTLVRTGVDLASIALAGLAALLVGLGISLPARRRGRHEMA
jgi:PKD repeat protein